MVIEYQAYSDMGCQRSNNEDIILIGHEFLRDEGASGKVAVADGDRFAAIVADGMGGNDGGELASDIAAQQFDTWLDELPTDLADNQVREAADQFAKATHALINDRGNALEGFHGMGTTLTGIFHYGSSWFWVNIGDSRVYVYRDAVLRPVTRDHSYRNLYNDPTQPSNLIYNCLGGGDQYDCFADADVLPVFDGDRFIICSDGLSDMIDDSAIEALAKSPQADVHQFIAAAKQAGGADNISVIIIDCGTASMGREPAENETFTFQNIDFNLSTD